MAVKSGSLHAGDAPALADLRVTGGMPIIHQRHRQHDRAVPHARDPPGGDVEHPGAFPL